MFMAPYPSPPDREVSRMPLSHPCWCDKAMKNAGLEGLRICIGFFFFFFLNLSSLFVIDG